MNTRIQSILMSLLAAVFVSCSEQAFNSAANAGKKEASKKPNGKNGEQNPGNSIDSPESVDSQEGTGKLEECSAEYAIPGTANIYFAGAPKTATIQYNFRKGNNTDSAASTSPIEIKAKNAACLTPGAHLTFNTTGNLSHGGGTAGANSPEGNGQLSGHALGATLGKSDVVAPLVSMVAVFIGPNDPSNSPAPAQLDFTSDTERNYKTLKPLLGQVFFVGDGKTDSGEIQKVVVPEGATRLYMGVWDVGQWNNNAGSLKGAINLVH